MVRRRPWAPEAAGSTPAALISNQEGSTVMDFTIAADKLLSGLYRALGVVEKKTTQPILSNVLIEATKAAGVSITASDLEIGVRGTHQAEVTAEGSITVSAQHLYDIVKSVPKRDVRIKRLPNCWAEIQAGSVQFKMMGISPDDFPGLPDMSKVSLFKIKPGALKEMIAQTSYAISNDESRPGLCGAFLEKQDDGTFRMVATDGHRLVLLGAELVEKSSKSKFGDGVVIPRKGLMEMKRLLEENPEEVQLGIDGNTLVFKAEDVVVVMRLLEAKFPAYRAVIPETQPINLTIKRKQLMSSLKRISILASDRTAGVKLILEKGRLLVTVSNADLGEGREEIAVEYDGNDRAIGFNAGYLIDALEVLASDEVVLSLEDTMAPAVVRVGGGEYVGVIMPLTL